MTERLDVALVRRGLARSRAHATSLIAAHAVRVDGRAAARASTRVASEVSVEVDADVASEPSREFTYVSRAGLKLAGALDVFATSGLAVAGRRWLDAGASTGGFTEVLLQRGAREVVAVDVGAAQLAGRLRADPRVVVLEHTNVRNLSPEAIEGRVDATVADLSFISLRLALPALARCTDHVGDLVLLVKPQFEVGRDRVGSGGVVRDAGVRREAVLAVVVAAADCGLGVMSATPSQLPGASGNVEYFLWLRAGESRHIGADITDQLEEFA